MDILQEYASTMLHLSQTADPYLRPIFSFIYNLQARTYPLILPYLNRAAVAAQDSPAILTVGVLLLFLLVAIQILNVVRRVMMWWIRVVWWISMSALLVVVVSMVWQRGPQTVLEDIVGWASHLSEVWWREYERWDRQSRMHAKPKGYNGQKGAWT